MKRVKKGLIKRISTAAASGFVFLASAAPAFAQVKLCPDGSPQFGGLCTLAQAPEATFARLVSLIIQLALMIAAIIAVIFLIWGGIRWIISGGDKAGVESARNTIIAAIIGLVIVFLSFILITVIGQIFGLTLFSLTIPRLTP